MLLRPGPVLALALSFPAIGADPVPGVHLARYGVGQGPLGGAQAIRIEGAALVHTGQSLPTGPAGSVDGTQSPDAQVRRTLDNLARALESAGSSLDQLVRLNAVTAGKRATSALAREIEARFRLDSRPAVTLVQGKLPVEGALMALDAVATAGISGEPPSEVTWTVSASLPGARGGSHAAVLPNGPRSFISGRAADGEPELAATNVLVQIDETLEHLGASREQLVQLKCFLRPIEAASLVESRIIEFYGGRAPPVVFVEWLNRQAIEIEAIVSAAPADESEEPQPIAYLTPPGMTASPVFSRIAQVFHPASIYVSSLNGRGSGNAEQQIRAMFSDLAGILEQAGSDLGHLAKATYYVSDESTSTALNQIRPEFYDPKSPPAASKASVRGTSVAGRNLAVDMIAVPSERQ
ncbi:MAG: Rid family hydrolase [Bryobacterales bacterium]|nr:Rid family hydrolase [Bryobacterales bacterium]